MQLQASNTPTVLVTLITVRGHAPREAGAKMLVTQNNTFETIGGGNLEMVAIEAARGMLEQHKTLPERLTLRLNHTESLMAVQCCGGEVEILLEPMQYSLPCVAIFGVGHVGLALAKILSTLPIHLWLVDSRAEMLAPERLKPLEAGQAKLEIISMPVLDGVVRDLPKNAHLLVMTHDHAEDLYVCKAALSRADLGFLGLIGSKVKWQHFQKKLLETGFHASDLARVTTPIGLPEIQGKTPEIIAVSVAAQVVLQLQNTKEVVHV